MKMKHTLCLLFGILSLVTVFVFGCEPVVQPKAQPEYPVYTSFRSIPNVTAEEIAAIEKFQAEKRSFVYGVVAPSTEFFVGEDGSKHGYSALLCDWLTTLFGIPFTPSAHEWDELLAGLKSGRIDFTDEIGGASEPNRSSYFMTETIAERTIKRIRLKNNGAPFRTDPQRIARYAFLEGSTTHNLVWPFLQQNSKSVFVDNYEDAHHLLKNGEVDAFFDRNPAESAFEAYGDVVVEDFYPLVYSPVFLTTQNPELAPIIAVVQKALQSGGVYHVVQLYNQGNADYRRHKLFSQLTAEEKAYVREHIASKRAIPLAAEYENYPISFYNVEEDEWQGIAFDVLEEIEQLSGLKFARANKGQVEWLGLMNMLESGEASIITELIFSEKRQGHFLWPDTPYQTDRYALLSRTDQPDIMPNEILYARVGLLAGTAYADTFHSLFPNHQNTVEYMGTYEAFDALERGDVEVLMMTQNHLLNLTNFLERPGFKVNLLFNRTYESAFGLNIGETALRSIVSKSLQMIDTNDIVQHWSLRHFDYRFKVAQARIPWLIGTSVLLLCILVLLTIMFLKGRRSGKLLEAAVHERTRQLEIQTEIAEKASRSKSEFLARTSHEIRTPMNVVIGMSALAIRDYGSPKCLEYLRGINHAGKSLLVIINDILDFSRIESGHLELIAAPYEVSSLLNDVLTLLRVRIAEAPLELKVEVPPSLPNAMTGDSGRVRQVLVNLLSNAVKYTSQGFIRFAVSGEPVGDGAIRLSFVVEDSGIGIRQEDIPKLFNDFTRVDEKRNSAIKGTGLGLSISRSLCHAMGGDIAVTSEYGKGSTFTATLIQTVTNWTPMGNIPAFTAEGLQTQHVSFTAPKAEVLVVDDFQSNLMVAEGLMEPYGMNIHTCQNGLEAVERIKARSFDLVLMDHMMPKMDGIEAVAAIRALGGAYVNLPIVALTANAVSGMREMFLAHGFSDFLAKPINMSELDTLLCKWIPAAKQQEITAENAISPENAAMAASLCIEGVDIAAGMARVGNAPDRYRELLRMFRRDAETSFLLLETTPDAERLSAFVTFVHALKSGLANIGADALSRSAAELEHAGRDKDMTAIRNDLPSFRAKLVALMARIGEATASAPFGETDRKRASAALLRETVTELKNALNAKDTDAMDTALTNLQALPLAPETHAAVSDIAQHILFGDFKKAMEALNVLPGQ